MRSHCVEISQVKRRPKVDDGQALSAPHDISEGSVNCVSRPRRPEHIRRLLDELGIEVDRRMLPHRSMICM
jgi:hypothetical protein